MVSESFECKYENICIYKNCIYKECNAEDSQSFCILYKYGFCKYNERCKYKHSKYQIKDKYIENNITDINDYCKVKLLLHNKYNEYSNYMENIYNCDSVNILLNDDSRYRKEIIRLQKMLFRNLIKDS